jgi:hypothetical protein
MYHAESGRFHLGRAVEPAQSAEVPPGQLSKQALKDALGMSGRVFEPRTGGGLLSGQPPVTLKDAAALDALTNIRKFYGSFKPEYFPMTMANLLVSHPANDGGAVVQLSEFKNDRETLKCFVPWLVQLSDWPKEEWTEDKERAYVQGVLKGLVKPQFIVNVVRNHGRLLSGVCRLRALRKWLRCQLSVMVNGTAVSRLELPEEDRMAFDGIHVRVTLYRHLTEADERELLDSMDCPAWQ